MRQETPRSDEENCRESRHCSKLIQPPSPRSDLIQQLGTARAARRGSSGLRVVTAIDNHDGFTMAVT